MMARTMRMMRRVPIPIYMPGVVPRYRHSKPVGALRAPRNLFDGTRFRSSSAHDGDGVTVLDRTNVTVRPVTKPAGSLQRNGSEPVCTTAERGPVNMGDHRSGLPRVWRAR